MAINFLNTVDLNKNQLNNARIQNLAGDPAAVNSSVGQIYFNTADDTLKQYVADDGTGNPGWVEVGATSGVETFTNISGTYVAFGADNAAAIGNVSVGTVDLTAVDGTSTSTDRFLTKNNKWATIPFGDITEVQGGTYINVTDQTGPIPIVNHDTTARTDTTSTQSPGYGGSFTSVDSVTTNTTGHITSINVKTVTLPPTENETYTLPVSAGAVNSAKIDLTAGGTGSGIKSTVEFLGTTGRIAITENVGNNGDITIDFPDDVTIVDDLTVGGVITQSQTGETNSLASKLNMNSNKITNVATGTASTDGVNLGQVELLVAGVGVFQGSYNASTNTPALSGASNVALDLGDYFVVSVAGNNGGYFPNLEPGDFIFANNAIAAGSSPAVSNYTVVQADANIAGSGATDGATQKGVSGFDSASFDVSANGWVQLNSQKNPYGAKQSLNNTSPSSRAEAGGVTTFTVDLADSSLFGTGALAENVKVEVTDGASPYQTVFAEVTRSGSASISIAFVGSVANDDYQVLLTYV